MPAGHIQGKLSGEGKDYKGNEDKILKRAYLAGFPNAKYKLRGQPYEIDFKNMKQKNMRSGKAREIRPPHKWKQPEKPIVEAGPTFCIKVPEGSPGTCIQVPHPKDKSKFISVNVPASAKVGHAMLVPVPLIPDDTPAAPVAGTDAASAAPAAEKKGWSTGAKVAAGGAGVVAVGGLAVAGALLGEHIAEEGWDATAAEIGDFATDAGEWIAGAAEDAGDFIMGLF